MRSLERRHAEADTLLHVHAALLYELQVQLRNLSATARHMSHNTGCKVNVIRTAPPLGMRDTLPPGAPAANTVMNCGIFDVSQYILTLSVSLQMYSPCLSVHQTVRLCITTVSVVLVFTPLSCHQAPPGRSTATWRPRVRQLVC